MKKKIIIALMACALSVASTACGNTTEKKDDKTKQSTESKKEIKEDTSQKDDSSDGEMSQAEWMEKNGDKISTEDGYDIVDNIDITSDTTSIKYTGFRIIEDTNIDGSTSQKLLLCFDFTNINDTETTAESHYNTYVYQNGIELDRSLSFDNYEIKDEEVENDMRQILSGSTIKIAMMFKLNDMSPIKVRITNLLDTTNNDSQLYSQQQEIQLQ